MATKTLIETAPSATAATDQAKPESKTYTNWNAFNIAGLRPVMIECQAYRPVLRSDFSCHTKLLPKADSFTAHIGHEHGGGFRLSVRKSDGKPSELWNQIAELGLEAHDFRCAACGAELRFHPTSLVQHMKSHMGMTKQSYQELQRKAPSATGFFNVLLKKGRPEAGLTDQDEFDQDIDA